MNVNPLTLKKERKRSTMVEIILDLFSISLNIKFLWYLWMPRKKVIQTLKISQVQRQ